MKSNLMLERFGEYFMYFIIAIWFGSEILLNTTLEKVLFWDRAVVNENIAWITLGLLAIQIIVFQRYEVKELVLVFSLSVPIVLGALNSGHNIMMSAWLFIIASKSINVEKALKEMFFLLVLLVPIVIIMYFNGYIDEMVIYRGSVLRHSWGFAHPNWLGVRVSQIILLGIYLKRKTLNIFDYMIIVAGIIFSYRVPNNQTSYVILSLFFIMLVLMQIANLFVGGQGAFAKILIWCSVFANFITIGLSIINVKKIPLLTKLDDILSHRFSWCHRTYEYYGLSLFGKAIDLYIKKAGQRVIKLYLDSAYMAILLRYGVFVYLIISVIYIATMVRSYKMNNYKLVIAMSIYALYGIMANSFYSLTQNVFLLFLSSCLYSKEISNTSMNLSRIRSRVRILI